MKEKLSGDVVSWLQEAVAIETGVDIGPESAARLYSALSSVLYADAKQRQANTIQEVTVLLTDLRGFTSISEAYPAETMLEVLNLYLARMCEIAIQNGGTIDKFMGDAIMLLFGAPEQSGDDARRAVTCAVQMQIAMEEINADLVTRGFPLLYMGAGINTGVVTAGLLGSELHSEYTVIGDEVNIASRIEAFSLRGQVLISETTFNHCRGFVATGEPMEVHVKGKSKPVQLREVFGIPALGLENPRRDVRNSPRVEIMIPFSYNVIVDKVVQSPPGHGVAIDISYQGILAEVESGLSQYADILMELDLSLLGAQKHLIYAKVCNIRSDQGRCFAGIEFTSLNVESEQAIRRFVQMLIQGSPMK